MIENIHLTKWRASAYALPQVVVSKGMPLHVRLGEAVDVARFFEKYWTTQKDSSGVIVRPGFDTVARGGMMHSGLGTEIVELREAVSAAEGLCQMAASNRSESPMERARFIRDEHEATLEAPVR